MSLYVVEALSSQSKRHFVVFIRRGGIIVSELKTFYYFSEDNYVWELSHNHLGVSGCEGGIIVSE